MIAINELPKLKRIEELSLREIDMVYSLGRTGWSSAEIGRRYRISESDAQKLVEDYVELRQWRIANPPAPPVQKNATVSESISKKPRKRRSDAIYATSKDRQAAYRARLKQTRYADTDQLSPIEVNDVTVPSGEKDIQLLQLSDEKP